MFKTYKLYLIVLQKSNNLKRDWRMRDMQMNCCRSVRFKTLPTWNYHQSSHSDDVFRSLILQYVVLIFRQWNSNACNLLRAIWLILFVLDFSQKLCVIELWFFGLYVLRARILVLHWMLGGIRTFCILWITHLLTININKINDL